jgi:hypothetical protein
VVKNYRYAGGEFTEAVIPWEDGTDLDCMLTALGYSTVSTDFGLGDPGFSVVVWGLDPDTELSPPDEYVASVEFSGYFRLVLLQTLPDLLRFLQMVTPAVTAHVISQAVESKTDVDVLLRLAR